MKITLTSNDILKLALEHLQQQGLLISGHSVDSLAIVIEGTRVASKSFGRNPYSCQYDWPINCVVQCGDGIVLTGKPSLVDALTDTEAACAVLSGKAESYQTAFFEAFPRSPDTFLRGEGKTIEEAENACWNHYQKILVCLKHEFERRKRDDGYCYCKHCGLSGLFLDPLHACAGCQTTRYNVWSRDKDGMTYCEPCFKKLPKELWSESTRRIHERH